MYPRAVLNTDPSQKACPLYLKTEEDVRVKMLSGFFNGRALVLGGYVVREGGHYVTFALVEKDVRLCEILAARAALEYAVGGDAPLASLSEANQYNLREGATMARTFCL